MTIHSGDPFGVPPEQRDPGRRFRGRLAAPVTVWTANGGDQGRVGITVSSVAVADGLPPRVVGVIDSLAEFWGVLEETRRFVVHVVDEHHRRLADQMAGRYPGPDARFEGLDVDPTEWGPVIRGVGSYVFCRLVDQAEAGHAVVVIAEADRFVVADDAAPLVHYRGDYFSLRSRER